MTGEKETIKELEREILKLRSEVRTDHLTRVLNRSGIAEEFTPLLHDAQHTREHGANRKLAFDDVALMFIDLDNFKKLNDTYGHEIGDTALAAIAELLARSIRGIDRVGRYGGEEFVILLPGASEADAYKKAVELLRSVKALSLGEAVPEKLSASVGVSALKTSGAETLEELIGYADRAMYEAKHNRGKGTVVRFSELPKE